MKIVLRAAAAVWSLGIGSVYAGDGDGYSATTRFTSIQDERPTPARNVARQTPTVAAQNSGAAVPASGTRSQGLGTSLFRVFSLP
jgi:hypothetical protein